MITHTMQLSIFFILQSYLLSHVCILVCGFSGGHMDWDELLKIFWFLFLNELLPKLFVSLIDSVGKIVDAHVI